MLPCTSSVPMKRSARPVFPHDRCRIGPSPPFFCLGVRGDHFLPGAKDMVATRPLALRVDKINIVLHSRVAVVPPSPLSILFLLLCLPIFCPPSSSALHVNSSLLERSSRPSISAPEAITKTLQPTLASLLQHFPVRVHQCSQFAVHCNSISCLPQ